MTEQNIIMEDAEPSAEELFEPTQMLRKLEADWKPIDTELLERVPISQLEVMPDLFQPREMSQKHIEDLRRAIKTAGVLDAMLVLPVGKRLIVIDGHHRMEAYKWAEVVIPVPVSYFKGEPREALFEAGRCNSKAKLPMENRERQNYAWKLVLLAQGSKADVSGASGISPSQVAIMRRVFKSLGEDAYSYSSWTRALRASSGTIATLDPDQLEEWKEAMAMEWADKLAKGFSTKMAKNPEVAAKALYHYFGRQLPLLVDELRGMIATDYGDLDGVEDDNPYF
ncbi:ParB/RepB/Spo0J family partition protein [Ferirhizobium litorale]|uniref:ParB/RepB/Spo0J family partition protein n=1 Tax=Ferirhizobium litorale TaxID=2927786 RepID=A0AAE3U3K2_9HYPH|nr:ParB/RepB/Spo0J family partition protein [Fererhizobium litorale]MDI7925239.1 ParB/RepB/Spo0J family partition protein [Fererhizobium litorale]